MVAAEAELARRAVHAARRHAPQLRFLDPDAAGKLGAHKRHDDVVARVEILRSADDLQRLGRTVGPEVRLAHIHPADPHMVAVGMRVLADDAACHDMVERVAQTLHAFHARARQIDPVAERLHVRGDLDVFGKPLQRYLHARLPS